LEGDDIEVTVKTPSRLHFSMIDMRGDLGRIHGSAQGEGSNKRRG
jgi:hypothetical protein